MTEDKEYTEITPHQFDTDDEEAQKDLPQGLKDSCQAAKALTIIHGLLCEGSFPKKFHQAVAASCDFVTILHQGVINEALKHPGLEKAEKLRLELEKAKL